MNIVQGCQAAMSTVRNVSLIQRSLNKGIQRLTNAQPAEPQQSTESYDPAVSEQMRLQIGSITDQIRKLENLVNRSQAAESALEELSGKAEEIREVAAKATDVAPNQPEQGRALQQEFDQLVAEFNDRLDNSRFNDQKLFNDSEHGLVLLRRIPQLDISTADVAKESLRDVDFEMKCLHEAALQVEAKTDHDYESIVRSLEVTSQNVTAAQSISRDPVIAQSQAVFLKTVVQQDSNAAAMAQGPMTSDTVFKLLHA